MRKYPPSLRDSSGRRLFTEQHIREIREVYLQNLRRMPGRLACRRDVQDRPPKVESRETRRENREPDVPASGSKPKAIST